MRTKTRIKSAKAQGLAVGLVAGWGLSGSLIIIGILLCCTGIGAIIGIPMIFAGFLAPILGPLLGLGAIKGDCPWCGNSVVRFSFSKGFDCPGVQKPNRC